MVMLASATFQTGNPDRDEIGDLTPGNTVGQVTQRPRAGMPSPGAANPRQARG
jgi:hypothetical protein